jgi:hypothetical protein
MTPNQDTNLRVHKSEALYLYTSILKRFFDIVLQYKLAFQILTQYQGIFVKEK